MELGEDDQMAAQGAVEKSQNRGVGAVEMVDPEIWMSRLHERTAVVLVVLLSSLMHLMLTSVLSVMSFLETVAAVWAVALVLEEQFSTKLPMGFELAGKDPS